GFTAIATFTMPAQHARCHDRLAQWYARRTETTGPAVNRRERRAAAKKGRSATSTSSALSFGADAVLAEATGHHGAGRIGRDVPLRDPCSRKDERVNPAWGGKHNNAEAGCARTRM